MNEFSPGLKKGGVVVYYYQLLVALSKSWHCQNWLNHPTVRTFSGNSSKFEDPWLVLTLNAMTDIWRLLWRKIRCFELLLVFVRRQVFNFFSAVLHLLHKLSANLFNLFSSRWSGQGLGEEEKLSTINCQQKPKHSNVKTQKIRSSKVFTGLN